MDVKFDVEKAWAVAVMRVGMGVLFFIAAANKFVMGLDKFRGYIFTTFKDTWLPQWALAPYAHALPFVEIAVGALLILGLFRCFTFAFGMLFMLSLTFGMMVAGKHDVVGINMMYLFFLGALMCVSQWDRFTVDALWKKPKRE